MKKLKIFSRAVFCLLILSILGCASAPRSDSGQGGGTEITAQGALGGLGPSGPLYTGDGGRNIRLAVLAPETQSGVPDYLPVYVQGLLSNNFGKYSAINLIDRQNLNRIISEQNIAASGRYSDNDFVRIGNLTNTQYFLFGTIQKLSGERYSLQLSITDSSTGVRRANFMRDGTLAQLEGRGTLINEAAADLLAQMGVQLTEAGRRTLLAGNTSTARAEAGLARGITAQTGGDEVEALFNITQAITFDPSNLEAISRLTTLSSNISGGTISERIVSDIQSRNRWLEVFKETARFFNNHPPFEITFDPNLIQIGQTDYARNTANIGMRIALDPSKAGFDALNTLLEGLEKTGKRWDWGFDGWPLLDITPKTAGTVVFGGKHSFSYKVDVEILNEANKTVGKSSITLSTETINFSDGLRKIQPPSGDFGTVLFPNVQANDLTPTLTIVITAVNGISSRDLNASGYMKIDTGDLEKREREREEAVRLNQAQNTARLDQVQREAEERKRNRERETEARKTVRAQEMATHPMSSLFYGMGVNGGPTLGTDAGIVDWFVVGGFSGFSAEVGVLFYPGLQKEKLKTYFGSGADSILGFDLGVSYSFLNPKWHISVGGGAAFLNISESNVTVPDFQVRFYWHPARIMFLSAGYRGDFYPGGFGDLLSKSSKPAPNEKFFWGHNLMFGMTLMTQAFR